MEKGDAVVVGSGGRGEFFYLDVEEGLNISVWVVNWA